MHVQRLRAASGARAMHACPRMFRNGSLTLFHVRGVPIRAHWTLLLILPYLALVLSMQFRSVADLVGISIDHLALPPLVWGLLLALGLFASVTLHELAHSLAAIRFEGSVRSITLMLLGGMSQLSRAPSRPLHEIVMAALGPVTSFALGGLLFAAYAGSGGWPADVQMGLFYLAVMNLALGVFNLIPAFPMDGGRLLRGVLAVKLGGERATQIAATVGKLCAVPLGLFGLWAGNLMLVLIAVFVYTGAEGELVHERVRDALAGLRLADLLLPVRRPLPTVASRELLAEVLPRMCELERLEIVVIDPRGAPLAVLQAEDLRSVATSAQWAVTVGELVSQLPIRHIVVPQSASANEAIERASGTGADYVLVVDPDTSPPGHLLGLLAAEDIARTVQLQLLGGRRLVARPAPRPRSRREPRAQAVHAPRS